MVNARQEEVSPDYKKKAGKLDSHVPGDDNTSFQDKLKTFGVNGRALGPTVGAWCETSTDFDLLVELMNFFERPPRGICYVTDQAVY